MCAEEATDLPMSPASARVDGPGRAGSLPNAGAWGRRVFAWVCAGTPPTCDCGLAVKVRGVRAEA